MDAEGRAMKSADVVELERNLAIHPIIDGSAVEVFEGYPHLVEQRRQCRPHVALMTSGLRPVELNRAPKVLVGPLQILFEAGLEQRLASARVRSLRILECPRRYQAVVGHTLAHRVLQAAAEMQLAALKDFADGVRLVRLVV